MAVIAIQAGHCYRRSGSTGTYREQEMTDAVGHHLAHMLDIAGHQPEFLIADPPGRVYPQADAFIALHCDGSNNASATSASYFHPTWSGATAAFDIQKSINYGEVWKRHHPAPASSYPNGFRSNNYVRSVSDKFYAWRADRVWSGQGVKPGTEIVCLVEHYFATHPEDDRWMWRSGIDRAEAIAAAHANALIEFYGSNAPPPPATRTDMRYIAARRPDTGGLTAQFLYDGFQRIEVNSADKLVNEHTGIMPPEKYEVVMIGYESLTRIPLVARPE